MRNGSTPCPGRVALCWVATFALVATLAFGNAQAQVLSDIQWSQLTASERKVLQPLKDQWGLIGPAPKQKWRDIAARYPAMTAEQQARTTSRMSEWAAMTPTQRNAARLQFEQVKQMPAPERQARWDAYKSLPAEQRDALSKQAAERAPAAALAARQNKPADRPQVKSNIVETTRPSAKAQPVGPVTVQAAVGASTRPITQSPTPPRHQQAGMPKIAASPGFVDSATLLPQRGPQGAAVEAARPAP
jgi:hypothetical protein